MGTGYQGYGYETLTWRMVGDLFCNECHRVVGGIWDGTRLEDTPTGLVGGLTLPSGEVPIATKHLPQNGIVRLLGYSPLNNN